ncbi:AAA family ATPase [Acidisoma sp. L85]|uniref:bifunctional aminoglycoside phosphotransferase/ATP-binding protein n=1 Tax=Acidisoma sp. L85 TaxID=1641850 RepID=UPI001C204EB4|nr:AAA family ATPase [Acidisoma sp. L85]
MTVNRENAPGLYLGVVPITQIGGSLQLGGPGDVVEWAVHLRRFDENATLDRLAAKGALGPALIDKLARAIVTAHGRAPVRDGRRATNALRGVAAETSQELSDATDVFSPELTAIYARDLAAAFKHVESLLTRRGELGQVRRCHGDLHLGNVVLVDGSPILFDAIEFDDAIATSDVLYDLAFLVMDLCERGLRSDANHLLNRYLLLSDDESLQVEGLAAFPFFLSLRAAIRSKVAVTLGRSHPEKKAPSEDALAYFEAARRFLCPMPPQLIAIGGLSGTGKTTIATAVAPFIGRAPGALHFRSDVERKHLFGVAETIHLATDAYQTEISLQVYGRLRELALKGLHAGQSVIVDATHHHPEERDAIAAIAARESASFLGVWLEAPAEVLRHRVLERKGDASDATPLVLASQITEPVGDITWSKLDAAQRLCALESAVVELAQRAGSATPDDIGRLSRKATG